MLNFKSNTQLDQEAAAQAAADAAANKPPEEPENRVAPRLNQFLDNKWEKSKRAKQRIYTQMLKNLRQRKGKYELEKLNAIKQMEGSEAFILLTDTKARAGESWIRDVMLQPGERPYDVQHTPVPDLPEEIEQAITNQFVDTIISKLVEGFTQSGQTPDMNIIKSIVNDKTPMFKQAINQAMKEKARANAEQIKDIIDDQLREGGWYKAFSDLLKDICDKKSCFLKGPVMRMEKVRKMVEGEDGRPTVKYTTVPIPTWERRSQWSIYPSPESTNVNDGYLFDVILLTRRDLASMIGVEGFVVDEIKEVLRECKEAKVNNWLQIENESEYYDALDMDTNFIHEREKIQCLEFWGSVPGVDLIEYGIPASMIADPDLDYDICCWKIGNHIIKAMLNPDQMGKKPFFKVSYEDDQDAFWGKCVPELIADTQGICNAIVRAIVNNVGVASGPQIELNIDRLEPGSSRKLWPLRVWAVKESDMINNAPAMRVYNITLNADKLITLYDHFSNIADEESGIPAYSHGDPNVGGAGNTASGLSQLMSASARGIKSVIQAIDDNIIAPSIEAQYFWNLDNGKFDKMVCDMNIVATGTSNLIARGQQAVRVGELLDKTNNPVDIQILGMEGRKDLLQQAAKANDIRLKGLNDSSIEQTIADIMQQLFALPQFAQVGPDGQPVQPLEAPAGSPAGQQGQGMSMLPMSPGMELDPSMAGPGGAPGPAPRTLDEAGNASNGIDTRLISHAAASAARGG